MLILGLLLLACTAAFVGLAIADNLGGGPDYAVTVLGHHIATMNGLAIFCAGLALALVFGLGLMLAAAGATMRRRRTRKLGAARTDAAAIARERDELAARLDRIHAEHVASEERGAVAEAGAGSGSVGAGSGGTGSGGAGPGGAGAGAGSGTGEGLAKSGSGSTVYNPPSHRQPRNLFGR